MLQIGRGWQCDHAKTGFEKEMWSNDRVAARVSYHSEF